MRLTDETKVRMRVRAEALRAGPLVIDGDVHPTDADMVPEETAARMDADPGYFHTRPLLSEHLAGRMDAAGVDMALCWQNPAMTPYGEDEEANARALWESNARIGALADAMPGRVIPGGWTDPRALGTERAIDLARRCVAELAMPIIKMNPAQNAYPIDDPMVGEAVDAIAGMGAVPAFHFGSDTPYTPAEGLAAIARRTPGHPVIGVHMGGGGGHFVEAEPVYQAARREGLANPDIFYVLSAKRDVHMEAAIIAYADAGPPVSGNIAAASDAPYGDMVFNMAGMRAMLGALSDGAAHPDPRLRARPGLVDEEMRQGVMGGNLARLVAEAYARILERDAAR